MIKSGRHPVHKVDGDDNDINVVNSHQVVSPNDETDYQQLQNTFLHIS